MHQAISKENNVKMSIEHYVQESKQNQKQNSYRNGRRKMLNLQSMAFSSIALHENDLKLLFLYFDHNYAEI